MTGEESLSAHRSKSAEAATRDTCHLSPATCHHFLAHAARIAARGLGRTAPNPSVGCVLVKNGVVIAVAHTADGGRPHAETQALALAGDAARGATAYVTLEPCAHHGHTPPCAQALIDAGVTRVVFSHEDPDPRVCGKGADMLRAAGAEVLNSSPHRGEVGWGATPSAAFLGGPPPTLPPMGGGTHLTRGFFRRVRHGLPEVSLKIATSRDNHIADPSGTMRWLTGEQARAHGHMLRATHDAVVTGIGTVLADDPLYTVRLPGITRPNLIRVVVDRTLRLPLDSQLVRTAEQHPLWLLTTAEAVERNASHATELRERGVVLQVADIPPPLGGRLGGGLPQSAESESAPLPTLPPRGGGLITPSVILTLLAALGLNRVLVEAGAALTAAFMEAGCVDTLHWYRAPMYFGNTGQAAPIALDTALQAIQPLGLVHHQALGSDNYERYELPSCLPD